MTLTDHIALVHARAAALSARVAIVGLEATPRHVDDAHDARVELDRAEVALDRAILAQPTPETAP